MFKKKTRTWIPIHSKEPIFTIQNNKLIVENLRDFDHSTTKPSKGKFIKKEYDLRKLSGLWFAVDYWKPITNFAHTFFSFQFGDEYLVVSAEARRTNLRQRPGIWGVFPLYKLYYSASTEKDMFRLRALRKNSLRMLLFKMKVKPAEARRLLEELAKRSSHVHKKQKIFNSIYRNCTTEILGCFDRATPKRFGVHWRRYATGHIDKYLVRRKLVETKHDAKSVRTSHDIKARIEAYKKGDFSKWIRKGL
jgi:hypothetical protein